MLYSFSIAFGSVFWNVCFVVIWLTLADWHVAGVVGKASTRELKLALHREHDSHAAVVHKYRQEIDYLRAEIDRELLEYSND